MRHDIRGDTLIIVIVIGIVYCTLSVTAARASSIQYHKRSSENSGVSDMVNVQRAKKNTVAAAAAAAASAETWQPVSQNNWIILQTPAKHAVVQAPSNQHSNTYAAYSNYNRDTNQLNTYIESQSSYPHQHHRHHYQQQQQQPKEQQHLAVNYYTYNHNATGNYQPPMATDVKLVEPYIVTISNMRARAAPSQQITSVLERRVSHVDDTSSSSSSSFVDAAIELPKDIRSNVLSPQTEVRQDIENNNGNDNNGFNDEYESSSGNGIDTMPTLTALDNNENIIDATTSEMENADTHLNEFFQPLQHTLDKVIHFCDIAKRFISDFDTENMDDDDSDLDNNTINETTKITPMTTINEVQGRHSASATTASTQHPPNFVAQSRAATSKTALSSIGTGRKVKKLKRKLSKFILPLLLAYKLKFLTLIPVLIGGLTLLVGTTGLAGFFFALFTAVMSLKTTSTSKSIIVKKI